MVIMGVLMVVTFFSYGLTSASISAITWDYTDQLEKNSLVFGSTKNYLTKNISFFIYSYSKTI